MTQTADWDADVIIVGSGFGGSVSALRLAEKGHKVLVIEAGRRWAPEEFARSNWWFPKSMWAPVLGWFGIQRITFLKDMAVLSGAGVGGGSLVYANTLLHPMSKFFADPQWAGLDDWEHKLQPHYSEALRMLGATASRVLTESDEALRSVAEEMGRGDTFHQPPIGVYVGNPGETVADPYFGGAGPARTGCTLCGACMTGCRVGAKNTLDRNYLFLAEKLGAQILPLHTACLVRPLPGGGYEVTVERTGALLSKGRRTLRARRVILSAGVLGTVDLLLRCKAAGTLPDLSHTLGARVRTNSESIVGVRSRRRGFDHTRNVAIASGFYPEPETHVEVVRYGAGHDAMAGLATLMVDGDVGRGRRLLRWLWAIVRRPGDFLTTLIPRGFARATIVLLAMQSNDNSQRLRLSRRWFFGRKLSSERGTESAPPSYIPAANLVARKIAARVDGFPIASYSESFFNVPFTAHILGGCPMGLSAAEGVIDRDHQVWGYPGLYVCDGSAVSANLGVNPALTISALTEYAMSKIPSADQR